MPSFHKNQLVKFGVAGIGTVKDNRNDRGFEESLVFFKDGDHLWVTSEFLEVA